MSSIYQFTSIAVIRSCFKEKFGIPRQPTLVQNPATIEIDSMFSVDDAFRELEDFSHIWVIFVFHENKEKPWTPTVRPPRLGGNQRIGVFASRSMYRPNAIGLSVVELKSIERKEGKVILNILGGDFLDLTPVIDIKPYVPYADAIAEAKAGYASEPPVKNLAVTFSDNANNDLAKYIVKYPHLKKLVTDILQLDPRPAYQKKTMNKEHYSMRLYEFDIHWRMLDKAILVTALEVIDS